MDKELLDRLKELKEEDFIWIIYIGLIILSLYSNNIERDYLINKNYQSKNKYRIINIIIFSTLVIIYFNFTQNSYKSYKQAQKSNNTNKIKYNYLALIGALLTLIGGLIFLYIALKDENIEVEIAF